MEHRTRLRLAFWGYLAFVVYGSLVPFELRLHSFDAAWQAFGRIDWLTLGPEARADWIANLVLYVPLGLLGAAWLAPGQLPPGARAGRIFAVFVACLAVALGVEFAQTFFAPRTVSLNDLAAEAMGAGIGCLVWLRGHRYLGGQVLAARLGGRRGLQAIAVLYLIGYLLLSLFPYDFVVSAQEFSARIAGQAGWLLAYPDASKLRTLAGLAAEALAILPLGLLAAVLIPGLRLRTLVLGSLALGIVLEALQLMLVSGTSQLASVLARTGGATAGFWLAQRLDLLHPDRLARWVARSTTWLLLPYLVALAMAAGWGALAVAGLANVAAQWQAQRFIPFYYHYYTTEPVAVASLLANLALYAPIGLMFWARHRRWPRGRRAGARIPMFWAASIAVLVETSKLWLVGAHPDYTNALIAALAAWLAYRLPHALLERLAAPGPAAPPPDMDSPAQAPRPARRRRTPLQTAIAIGLMAIAGAGLLGFPLFGGWLALGLGLYVAWLWAQPLAGLIVVPVVAASLDLTPYTGMLALSALDLTVLVSAAMILWRHAGPPRPWPNLGLAAAWWLTVTSTALSLLIGLWPAWQGMSGHLGESHAPLSTWSVGKGMLAALLLVALLRRVPAEALGQARNYLLTGLALTAIAIGVTVIWERHVQTGLFDLDDIYRVTGSFSAMRTGGAVIDAFLVLSAPALLVGSLTLRPPWRMAGLIALLPVVYATMATYSRITYLAFVVGLLIAIVAHYRANRRARRAAVAGAAGIIVVVAAAVLASGFAQHRFARTLQDLSIRLDHWGQALALPGSSPLRWLAGSGFGQYPARYLVQGRDARPPGIYYLPSEGDHPFLRLGGGDNYYLDRVVEDTPDTPYTLTVEVRFAGATRDLRVALCHKALLYSQACAWGTLSAQPAETGWQALSVKLDPSRLPATRATSPNLKLTLAGPTGEGYVDMRTLTLRDATGRALVDQPAFASLRHWLGSTDRDLAWHPHQSFLDVLVAQGLLGLIALGTLLLAAARLLRPAMRAGDPLALALGAGLAGWLLVALVASTLDAARSVMLLYTLAFATVLLPDSKPTPTAKTRASIGRPDSPNHSGTGP